MVSSLTGGGGFARVDVADDDDVDVGFLLTMSSVSNSERIRGIWNVVRGGWPRWSSMELVMILTYPMVIDFERLV